MIPLPRAYKPPKWELTASKERHKVNHICLPGLDDILMGPVVPVATFVFYAMLTEFKNLTTRKILYRPITKLKRFEPDMDRLLHELRIKPRGIRVFAGYAQTK